MCAHYRNALTNPLLGGNIVHYGGNVVGKLCAFSEAFRRRRHANDISQIKKEIKSNGDHPVPVTLIANLMQLEADHRKNDTVRILIRQHLDALAAGKKKGMILTSQRADAFIATMENLLRRLDESNDDTKATVRRALDCVKRSQKRE